MKVQAVLISHQTPFNPVAKKIYETSTIMEAVKNYICDKIFNLEYELEDDVFKNMLLEYNLTLQKEKGNVYHLQKGQMDLYFSEDIEKIKEVHRRKGVQIKTGTGISTFE